MFDFEKLEVYKKANSLNVEILKYLCSTRRIDPYTKDQLKRATLSMLFNLAEGVGRVTVPDKKHFYTIARGSVFECVAIINLMRGVGELDDELHRKFYDGYDEISRMLLAIYRKTKKMI